MLSEKINAVKIYTKTGDKGKTSLIGGKRVSKASDRLEAYGTVDELIAYIGLVRDHEIDEEKKDFMIWVQDVLMRGGSVLAADMDNYAEMIPLVLPDHIKRIEREIDAITTSLPPLKSFVLPGGSKVVSFLHIARTICRRAERRAVVLKNDDNNIDLVITFLNRLSDYLFVISRRLSIDLNADEIPWEP